MAGEWSKITVGSNVFLNKGGRVPGILIVDGEGQITVGSGGVAFG